MAGYSKGKTQIAKQSCHCCWQYFQPDTNYTEECNSCLKMKSKIANNSFDEKEVYPNLKLTVKYSVTEQDHDGYCSDPHDETTTERTIKKIYSLPRWFKKSHLNGKHVKMDCEFLKYFAIDPKPHGNGYCGMETVYGMISASIRQRIKDKSNPDLNLDD